MGLFDDVLCQYPLPGNPPLDRWYQTKDLDCDMSQFTITADGRIDDKAYANFTGTIDISWSNVVGSGPVLFTANGEDAETLEYRLVFINGKIVSAIETGHDIAPAAKSRRLYVAPLTDDDKLEIDRRQSESLVGKTVCLWYGGQRDPINAPVIAETAHDWVLNVDGRATVVGRYQRDCTLFDSPKDAQEHFAERARQWRAEKAELEAEIAAKRKKAKP